MLTTINFFPLCYKEGSGYTLFNTISKWVMLLIYILVSWIIYKKRSLFTNNTYKYFLFAIVLLMLEKAINITYQDVAGIYSFFSHLIRIIGFMVIFLSIKTWFVEKPIESLYENLLLEIDKVKKTEQQTMQNAQMFKALYDSSPVGYQVLDIYGNCIMINQTFEKIYGYSKQEVIGHFFGDFMDAYSNEKFMEQYHEFKEIGKIDTIYNMIHKNGQIIATRFIGRIEHDKNNEFNRAHCVNIDMTEDLKYQKAMFEAEERLNRSQEIAETGSWELDVQKNTMWVSKQAYAIYDLPIRKSNPTPMEVFEMFKDDEKGQIDKAIDDLINFGRPYDLNFTLKTASRTKIIHSMAKVAYDEKGNPKKILGVIRDITKIKEYEESLHYLGYHDYLTDLYNRRYFVEKYNQLDSPSYYPLAIMMLDVNGLKIINDAYGHNSGDIALKKAAEIMKKSFREQDVIARIGGDEFAILLPNITVDEIEEIKERLKIELDKYKVNNLTISIATGYELKTKDKKENLDEMLKLAENHMYRHKITEGVSVRNHAIKAILRTLTDKYETERIHSEKVSYLCKLIGEKLDLREDDLNELELAGMYHDIGKISIPDAILNKPGRLTDEEYAVIKTHPEISYQILRAADEYSDLAVFALHHHERWDGNGYPAGLKGNDIPLFSRIISVVDAYEAMTAVRPYKDKMSHEEALKEIKRCSGSQFDPTIAEIFISLKSF
jgi:diguanylate cyclase (GGDEF)-like protein/PAS domain S-box-containing protein